MAFAVFLMVKEFRFSVHEVTTLFVINNVMNYFLFPLIGKDIIRFGERKILFIGGAMFSFVSLMAVQGIQTQR